MKKLLIMMVTVFAITSNAKTLDEIGKMTYAEFYATDSANKNMEEFLNALNEEYGPGPISEAMGRALYEPMYTTNIVGICEHISEQPKRKQSNVKKMCSTTIAEGALDPIEKGFRKLGLL